MDISALGMGLEVFGVLPSDVIGRCLTVEVNPSSTPSVSLTLSGEVRHMRLNPKGGIRLGLEFSELSETEEKSIVDALKVMQIAW